MEDNVTMSSVERYLYPSGSECLVDSHGLLFNPTERLLREKLIGINDAAKLPGGILLAEGGMGKTTFMELLKGSYQSQSVHLFKLGEYVRDPGAFRNELKASLAARTPCTQQIVLLDGLDEAPDLAGAVLRAIQSLPASTSVWLASRDITALHVIQSERPELKSYKLAPLCEMDLRTLAKQASVDAEAFLDAAARQGLLPICAKPLGCELALSVFRENGLVDVAQRDLWQRGIERLCDETPSTTRQLSGTPKFSLDEVMRCSAWISLCLTLSENHFVWSREHSYRPEQSLCVSDLGSDQFSGDLIRTTIERGVFSPVGDGRVAYSHKIYRDYLGASGFASFIPAEHWTSLLMNGQRDAVFPQRAGIATWLATYNKGFLAELLAAQPELLLSSADSVQAIGPDQLCEALLERADGLSLLQLKNVAILSNLYRLKDSRTPDVLKTCLLDPDAGSAAIKLATRVTEACEYAELAGVLADRVLDAGLSLGERVDAAYAVWRLNDDRAKGQLKELLPIDPSEDPHDDLRGIVLRTCWPEHLGPSELVEHLAAPQESNYLGAYSRFLDEELPATLEPALDENSAVVLLNWAIPHINEDDYGSLGRLARSIYSICWAFTGTPAVAEVLASGYSKAVSEYRTPFLSAPYDWESKSSQLLNRKTFLEDVDGRLTVLEIILSRSDMSSLELGYIPFNGSPLYTQGDLPALFDRAAADPSGPLTEKWAFCIRAVVYGTSLDSYADQVDRLHDIRPDLIDDSQKLRADMEAAAKRARELDQRRQKKELDRKKEQSDNQDRIDSDIKKALQSPILRPESFDGLSSWLNSKEGKRFIGSIDIQLSPGWTKLTKGEQSVMLDLAQRFLTEAQIPTTAPGQISYTVAYALTALRLRRPSVYAGLSCEVWQKCGVELLKAPRHDNLNLLAPLFDTLSERCPEVATETVLQVLSQELQRDYISIIHNWGTRLNDAQAEAIMTIADDPATDLDRRFLLLSNLARYGKESLVRAHLDSMFSGGWAVPPDASFHKFRHLAFVLSPASYIRELLNSLASDPNWGREWFESTMPWYDNVLLAALVNCEVTELAEIYLWLNDQCPPEKCPEPEPVNTTFSLLEERDIEGETERQRVRELYEFKSRLLSYITASGKHGSSDALQKIANRFPSDAWLASCVLDARTAEQAKTAPVFPIAKIKELCEQRNASRCLVSSIQDLLEITMTSLEAYRTYLQGDTPAVADVWNTMNPIQPRDEEYLSDHLKRYLDLSLTTDVVINREVQIRRKLFSDGAPGSRTDIWIEATDEDGIVLTLCIEVKCNWNAESKSALKNQLVGKYMSGGTATAGILLLAWFECGSWDSNDWRLAKSTATWTDPDVALADLRDQADVERANGSNVYAIVIDCGLR